MGLAKVGTVLSILLLCICLQAETKQQKITATGTLTRVMAIGGESAGWVVQLDSGAIIDGKQVSSIEVE